MKKLKSFGVAAMAALLLTSCLDGKNESPVEGFGVADFSIDAMGKVVYVNDALPVYSPQFKDLNEGDCVYFRSTYRGEDNDGSKKYWVVTNAVYSVLDSKGYLNSSLDTANIKTNEMVAIDAGISSYVIKNYIFLYSGHEKTPADQKNSYTLEYNPEPIVVDGKRVYDFFLRVVKTSDGTGTSGSNLFNYAINTGGQFKHIESKELSEGNEQLNIRLNYLKSYDEETKVATWGKSQIYSVALQKETV